MENGTFFDESYFKTLLAEIRKIRISVRRFYQEITNIYANRICIFKFSRRWGRKKYPYYYERLGCKNRQVSII